MRTRKKLVSILCAVTLLVSALPAASAAIDFDVVEQRRLNEISALLSQRVYAHINNDFNKLDQIEKQLAALGARNLSDNETCSFLGRSVNYEEAIETPITYAGKSGKIIYVTPTDTRSNLWHSGSTNTKWYTANAEAASTTFLGSFVYGTINTISPINSVVDTIYSAFSDTWSGLSPTTYVNNVRATYSWNFFEACSFVYFLDASDSHYTLYARYSKIDGVSNATVYSATFGDGDPHIDSDTLKHNLSVKSNNFESLYHAYYNGQNGTYTSMVDHVDILGVNDEKVASISTMQPMYPGSI